MAYQQEREYALEKLKQSERRLAEAQQVAHIGSWERDLRTNEVNWSDELYRLFGLQTVPTRRQLLRHTLGSALHLLGMVARDRALRPTDRLRWWGRTIPYSFAQSLGQYLGARSVAGIKRRKYIYLWCERILGTGI